MADEIKPDLSFDDDPLEQVKQLLLRYPEIRVAVQHYLQEVTVREQAVETGVHPDLLDLAKKTLDRKSFYVKVLGLPNMTANALLRGAVSPYQAVTWQPEQLLEITNIGLRSVEKIVQARMNWQP